MSWVYVIVLDLNKQQHNYTFITNYNNRVQWVPVFLYQHIIFV